MDAIVKSYEKLSRDGYSATDKAVTFSNYLILALVIGSGLVAYLVASRMVKSYSRDLEAMSAKLESTKVELERAKLKERFAYVASHDLQEPIRTVISLSELLEDSYKDKLDPETMEIVRFIHESSYRMSRQISGLLDYSRLGKNQHLQKVDINSILKDVKDDLQKQIELSNAEIRVMKMPVVLGYPVELRSTFQNLLSNALKFCKPQLPPEVVIDFEETKKEWLFSVKDNGIGIDPAHKEKIFHIFQRLNSRDAFEGFGIGLAHCQRVAELHRGTIWVDSKPGQGCTFWFSISKSLK